MNTSCSPYLCIINSDPLSISYFKKVLFVSEGRCRCGCVCASTSVGSSSTDWYRSNLSDAEFSGQTTIRRFSHLLRCKFVGELLAFWCFWQPGTCFGPDPLLWADHFVMYILPRVLFSRFGIVSLQSNPQRTYLRSPHSKLSACARRR